MSDRSIPVIRQRFLEDMRIKGLQPKTQTMYLRGMREFTRFLGRSPDSATPDDLRAFQLDMSEKGVGAATFNNRLTVLSFFFSVTCVREEMKRYMRYQRVPRKIPVVLSAERGHAYTRSGSRPRPEVQGRVQRGLWRRTQGQ